MAAFVEPTRRIPLRFGRYNDRYLAGILYICAGTVILLSSNTYTIEFLLVGTVANVAGWFILPARGSRRIAAALPSVIVLFLLLTGPQVLASMAVTLLLWLFVRERPLRSYAVLVLPVAAGVLMANAFHSNHDEPMAFAIETVTVIGSAWLARLLATTRRAAVPHVAGR